MAAVQQGMKSAGFRGTKPNPYRERSTVNLHTNCPSTWAPANPASCRRTQTLTTTENTCGPTQTPDDIDIAAIAGEVRRTSAPSDCGPKARTQYLELEGRFRRVLRGRSLHAGDASATRSSKTPKSSSSAGDSPDCWPGRISRRPASTVSASSRWPATSAACGTGIDSPESSATTTRTATSRCSKSWTSCRRRSSPTAPRSSSTAATSASTSACTTARCSPPRYAKCTGTTPLERWRISTDRGDDIRARFVVMAQGSYNRPKLPGIPGIKDFTGPRLPLRALGLRLHRRRRRRRPGQAGGQARRARRHRCDRDSVGTAPRPRCQAALRIPANAVVGGRAHQHSHRSGLGRLAAARLAGGAQAQLPQLVAVRRRGVRRAGPGVRLLD